MARALSSQKVFHQLTGIFRLEDDTENSTVSVGAAKGSLTAITIVAAGAFAAGDKFRVGAFGNTVEINEIDSITTNDITPKLPWSRAIVAAEVVYELKQVDLGATDENGVNLETTMGETPIVAGTQKQTYLYINQNVEETLTFALRDFDMENVIASLGMDDSAAGYVSAKGGVVVLDDVVTVSYQAWCFEGLLEDATAVTAFIFSAKVASANQTLQFAEGAATIIPFTLRSNGNRSFLLE